MDPWFRPTSTMMWPPNPRAPWCNTGQQSLIHNIGLASHPPPSRPPLLYQDKSVLADASKRAGPTSPPSDPHLVQTPRSIDEASSAPTATTVTEQSTNIECSSNDSQPSEVLFSTDLPAPQQPIGTDASNTHLSQPDQTATLPLLVASDASTTPHLSQSNETPTLPLPPCISDASSGACQTQSSQTPTSPPPCMDDGLDSKTDSRWSTNPASPLKSVTMTKPSCGIPSPTTTNMFDVSSNVVPADKQAASILKYQIIKSIHRLSLKAAYVRLWRIMPPLDTEDPGIGNGEFLGLRNRIVPRQQPISEQQSRKPKHCDRHVPRDVMRERTSLRDLLLSPQSDDEDGDGNADDTFLSGVAGVELGLPNIQRSPKIVPHSSMNERGDGYKTNIQVECEERCRLQTESLRHSDDECLIGNSDFPSFHSAREISMGTTTPCSLAAMSPQQSDQSCKEEGSSSNGKGSDTSLPGGRDILTWPAAPCPVRSASFPHSHVEGHGEGENLPRCSGIGSMAGPATLLPLQAMPRDQCEQRGGSNGNSSFRFSQKNAHSSCCPHRKPKRTQLPKLHEASLTRSSPSRPSGASVSPPSKKGLTSTPRTEPHRGNHTDTIYEGTAGLLADRQKAFRDMLDWLHEEYELLTQMLYYTEEECAKIDAIAKVCENQLMFSYQSINEADDKNEEEAAAFQLKVGTDLILAAMEKLKETHAGRKVLRSIAQRFSQNEGEKINNPTLESSEQNKAMREKEVTALKIEVESWKEKLASSLEKLQEAEYKSRVLQSMMQRFVLTEEEMEEVVLKRCWLARYWGLAVQYDLFPDIAKTKHDRWSEVAPLPDEVVTAVGERTKKDFEKEGKSGMEKRRIERDLGNLMGKLNIESMLSVERELRELTALKVEEAVMLEISKGNRRSRYSEKKSESGPPSLEGFRRRLNVFPSNQSNLLLKLSEEEAKDIHFKRAWLAYFWGRAVNHGVEEDTAKDRLQYWISRMGCTPTFHEAVDVGRDMEQLKKLEIELKLWKSSRGEIDIPSL